MKPENYTYEFVYNEFKSKGYELISDKYIVLSQKLDYICNKHREKGIQNISFYDLHIRDRGCPYCGREKAAKKRMKEIDKDEHKQICESKGFIYIDSERINKK